VASAAVDANADYESTAGSGDERRPALEEKTVQRASVSTVREMMDWPVAQVQESKVAGLLAAFRILGYVSDPPGGFVPNRRASLAPTVEIQGPRPG
jgi:hypothetical protein